MRYTVNQLMALTRRGMGNPTEEQWSDVELLNLINNAQVTIAEQRRPPILLTEFTIIATAGGLRQELPENFMVMSTIVNRTIGNQVDPIDDRINAAVNQGVVNSGPILKWWEDEGTAGGIRTIAFWLIPDSDQELYCKYLRFPTDSVLESGGGDDYLYLPREFDQLTLREAISKGLSYDFQLREAQSQKMYGQIEHQAVSNIEQRPPNKHYPMSTPIGNATRRHGGNR